MNNAQTRADAFAVLFFETDPTNPGIRRLRGVLHIEDNDTWCGHDRQVPILGWVESKNGHEYYCLMADGYSGSMITVHLRPEERWCYDFDGAAGPDHEFLVNGWKFQGDEHGRPHIVLWITMPVPLPKNQISSVSDRTQP